MQVYRDLESVGFNGAAAMTRPPVVLARVESCVIYLAIFLSPFRNFQTEFFYFTLSDALYCLASLILLLRGRFPRYPLGVMTPFWYAAFLLIAGGLLFSSLISGDPIRGLVLLLQYFFCFALLPHILLHNDENEAYRLLLAFIFGIFALDAHGIITFYTVGYVPGSPTVTGGLRLATLNGSANGVACLNAMAIVMVLWLRSVRRLPTLMALCLLGVMFFAVVLTSSNTGLIATTTGLLIFFAATFRPRSLINLLPFIIFAAVFLQFGGLEYLPPTFQKRVLGALVSGEISEAGTFVNRRALMIEAMDIIAGRGFTLFGMGADQFRVHSVQGIPVHNTFLIQWSEGGLLSFAGWVLLSSLGIILWLLAWRKGVAPKSRAAAFACFAVLVAVGSASTHLYARYWYTALLLAMQPTIIALSRSPTQADANRQE